MVKRLNNPLINGLPKEIIADHGEFQDHNTERLMMLLGIRINYIDPRMPSLKSIHERRSANSQQAGWKETHRYDADEDATDGSSDIEALLAEFERRDSGQ